MSAVLVCQVANSRCFLGQTAYIHKRIASILPINRSLSTKPENSAKKGSGKYKSTVLLPKTEFPLWLDPRHRAKHDADVLKNCGFSSLYNWQRDNLKGDEFVLHDGPPYANGVPHVGHAVNKILKDIIMRYELLRGRPIHFVPGWDCHGLPIELKAMSAKGSSKTVNPLEIREKARVFASEAIEKQREAFISWGILGDWDNTCYFTFTKKYVKNQLRQFYSLFEKGFVYRDMKPIYWSPSSRTALAEAELQYNKEHKSTCVTVRVKLLTKPFNVDMEGDLYALIWTTTPWTLPANEAVTYKSDMDYSIVNIEDLDGHYILATKLVPELERSLSKPVKIVQNIPGRSLKRATYSHPIYKNEVHKFLHAEHVTDEKGTGLVHCAPSHGREDYVVAVENNLKLVSLVDKEGNYVETAGTDLVGKNIMGDGSEAVKEMLKNDIIHTEELVHSYPYDWRTNKPVFMLASEQWFFDCSAVKENAIESLKNVAYAPDHSHSKSLSKLVKERPFWCISRQRVWGVPIPVLFKRDCKNPIISKELIEHYCDLVGKHGSDFWWKLPNEDICPPSIAAHLGIETSEIDRCPDILDIWFDSGLSWSAVLEGRTADMYLEGSDQLVGWFQSSMLTSVALTGKAPYRKIFTHGFVVDENGHKMSKSIGNVIDPCIITSGGKNLQKEPAFGVDSLRWWAAAHSVQHANIPISVNLIKLSADIVHKFRGTIRYALGALHDFPADSAVKTPTQNMYLLDQYMLHSITALKENVNELYSNHKYNTVCSTLNNFVVNDVSSLYFTLTKDRLFCDMAESERRRSCQFVIYYVLETLLELVAPITPLLVEETYDHHPIHAGKRFFEFRTKNPVQLEKEWLSQTSESCIKTALELKSVVSKISEGKNIWSESALVKCSDSNFSLLKPFIEGQPKTSSQLTEILQVGSVVVEPVSCSDDEFQVQLTSETNSLCIRCRRFGVMEGSDICTRCTEVLDSPLNALKHSFF